MDRFAGVSALRSLVVTSFVLLVVSAAQAQITDVNDTTSTPVEGAGHDYIRALSETVNPANGSLSLRIQVPVAKGRGLTIPFSFGYDSNGFRHLKPGFSPNYGTVSWVSNTGYTGQGGWVYSIPQLNLDSWTGLAQVLTGYSNGQPVYQNYYCDYATAYTFRDGSGGVHALGLGARVMEQNPTPEYCMYSTVTSGGDPQVGAVLTTRAYGLTTGDEYLFAPVNVYTADGTLYYFATAQLSSGDDTTQYVLPTYIEDRNGNKITVSGSTFTDTLGRTLFSGSLGSAGQTKTVSISGINYQVTWKSVSASYPVTPQWAGPASGPLDGASCWPIPAVNDTQTVASKITLPNGQAYNFYYGNDATPHTAATNSYGLLSEVDYPDGGWVQYTWKPSDTQNELADYPGIYTGTCPGSGGVYCPTPAPDACLYQYKTPVVSSRIVSFSGSTPSLTQTFTYSTTWNAPQNGNTLGTTWSSKSTNVTTTDNVLGKSNLTKYNYGYVVASPVPFSNTTLSNQIPVESSASYYDWGNTTTPVRTVTKSWYDQYDLASESISEGGKTSQTTYCYVGTNCVPGTFSTWGQLQEKDDYDFGAATPTRKTVTTWQGFTGTTGVIADAPCKTVVSDGSGNRYAETDYLYDGGTTLCGTVTSSTATTGVTVVSGTHDESLFGPSSTTPRGNLTQKTQWASTGASPVTKYAYDETGQVLTKTEPCGITQCSDMTTLVPATQYSYADSYTTGSNTCTSANGPAGNTNAFLTKVIYPPTNGVVHSECFSYNYTSGQLTGMKDENGQLTTYAYSDPFLRPTQTNFPDGGQTEHAYNDSAPSPSITTCQLINGTAGATCSAASPPTGWKTTLATMDGLGRVVQTQLASDPDSGGTVDYVDTVYDGMGRVSSVSNPHRSSSLPTDGTTTNTYDALGRTTLIQRPDGSSVQTVYDQTCSVSTNGVGTTVTDETGNVRESCSDGLGRLIEVDEPGASGLGSPLVTQYTYDTLNNLTCTVQKGTDTTAFSTCAAASANWRPRSFVYDSLSRLTSATNPESGTITYTYDLNSNLATRVTPKANQTGTLQTTHVYTYDVLNRLLTETHAYGVTGSADEYAYDGATLNTGCGQNPPTITATYTIGRRSAMCGQKSGSSWSYDPMGRPLLESTRNMGSAQKVLAVNYTYNKDGSLWKLTYPSGDVVTYTVGGAGRASQVTDSTINFATSATYAPPGLLTGMTNGAGIVTSNIYNDRLQPILLSAGLTGQNAFFSLCYDFHLHVAINNPPCSFSAYTSGNNGNVFQVVNKVDPTRSAVYAYDPLNRVSQANTANTTSSNCWGEAYTVDSWGNLTNIAAAPGMAGNCVKEGLAATPTTQNQLNGIGLQYDAAGNVTTDNLGNTPTYDQENRIATDAGFTYYYDADGARMEKSTGSSGTMYWPGPSGTLTETDLTGTINEEYIYFNGQRIARVDRPSGTVHYYFSNHLGSHSMVTSATAVCEQDIDYYPYGGVVRDYCATVAQHYKFTGKERDNESGLDNFGARYDASTMGRFMTPDPSPNGIAPGDPQSWNLYSYVRNRPTRSVDVGGHWATDVHAEMVTVALQGYLSAGELQHLVAQQYVMDKDQSPNDQYMHAMRKPGQSAADASAKMWDFVATMIGGANATLSSSGGFTSISLDWLGDAIHTVEDYTSPMHTSASGEPLVWGGGSHPIQALGHWQGENSPSDNWADFGKAIRLTMAAFMQANPGLAAKNGLTEASFNAEADRRISQYVGNFYKMSGNVMSTNQAQEEAARQCALGNPAACD